MNIVKDSNIIFLECKSGEKRTYFPKDKFYKKVKFFHPYVQFSENMLYSPNNDILYDGDYKINLYTKNKGYIIKDIYNNSFLVPIYESQYAILDGNYIKVNDFLIPEDCYIERENNTLDCIIPFFVVWEDSEKENISEESNISTFKIKNNIETQSEFLRKFMLSEIYENINTINDKTIKNFIVDTNNIRWGKISRYDVFVFKIKNGGYFEVPCYLLISLNSDNNLLFFNSFIDFDNSYIISNDFSKIKNICILWN